MLPWLWRASVSSDRSALCAAPVTFHGTKTLTAEPAGVPGDRLLCHKARPQMAVSQRSDAGNPDVFCRSLAGNANGSLAGTNRIGANRQIIVEVFPPDHRRALRLMDRQIIVEIGGGSEPSSSWRLRPEPPAPRRNEFGVEAGWRADAPAISAGISRMARRAGRVRIASARLARPREGA